MDQDARIEALERKVSELVDALYATRCGVYAGLRLRAPRDPEKDIVPSLGEPVLSLPGEPGQARVH